MKVTVKKRKDWCPYSDAVKVVRKTERDRHNNVVHETIGTSEN